MNEAERTAIDILDAGEGARMAYVLPVSRPGRCTKCSARTWGDDKERGVCTTCVEIPISEASIRLLGIPARYRWARLDRAIRPPNWISNAPLVSESVRARALAWATGGIEPSNALTIASEVDGQSRTGTGKSSLAAAVAREVSIRRKLEVTWVHASELRADHEDPDTPREALRRLLESPLVVLDGLGKELGGATDVRGWQPARMSMMMEYATRMYERPTNIRITTVDLPGKTLAGIYGGDFVRRFGRRDKQTGREENATIITL